MDFLLRRARHEDAPAIIHAHVRSIREVCAKDYTPEQIEAWAGRDFKIERWCETIDRDFVWVVEINQKVHGFGHLRMHDGVSAEVMGLYFAPEACGKGAAKKLFSMMIEEVKQRNISRLFLHATITAKPFYERLGFLQIDGNCTVNMRGISIPCFPMERLLK